MNESIDNFIRYMGTGAKVARALGVTEATVSRWRNGRPVPVEQAKRIQALTDGRFTAVAILGLNRAAA